MNFTLQKIVFIIVLLFTAVGIYVLNSLYPVYADDWVYSLFYESSPHRPVSGFLDLCQSQYNHYMLWGGRTVAHTIAQVLLLFDPMIQDILNTIAFVFFIVLMYNISNLFNRKMNGLLLLFIVCMLWVFTDSMLFSSAIWITGAANYLWTSLILLVFIYPFFKYLFFSTDYFSGNKLLIVGFVIWGGLSGWTNENSVIAVLFFLLCFFLLCKRMKKKIPQWAIYSSVTFLLGCGMMFLAPGNYMRLAGTSNEVGYQSPPDGLVELVSFKIGDLFHTLHITYTLYITVFVLLLAFIYFLLNRDEKLKRLNVMTMVVILTIMSYIAAAAMMGTPYISYRTIFFSNSLLIIAAGVLFVEICNYDKLTKTACVFFVILLLLFTVYDYSKKYKTLYFISNLWKNRDEFIEQQKSIGNTDIVFPTTFTAHPKFLLNEMSPDPEDSRNTFYSIYKGVNSIRSDSSAVMLQTP